MNRETKMQIVILFIILGLALYLLLVAPNQVEETNENTSSTYLSDFNCYVNGSYYPDWYCEEIEGGEETMVDETNNELLSKEQIENFTKDNPKGTMVSIYDENGNLIFGVGHDTSDYKYAGGAIILDAIEMGGEQ